VGRKRSDSDPIRSNTTPQVPLSGLFPFSGSQTAKFTLISMAKQAWWSESLAPTALTSLCLRISVPPYLICLCFSALLNLNATQNNLEFTSSNRQNVIHSCATRKLQSKRSMVKIAEGVGYVVEVFLGRTNLTRSLDQRTIDANIADIFGRPNRNSSGRRLNRVLKKRLFNRWIRVIQSKGWNKTQRGFISQLYFNN